MLCSYSTSKSLSSCFFYKGTVSAYSSIVISRFFFFGNIYFFKVNKNIAWSKRSLVWSFKNPQNKNIFSLILDIWTKCNRQKFYLFIYLFIYLSKIPLLIIIYCMHILWWIGCILYLYITKYIVDIYDHFSILNFEYTFY